MSGLNAPPFLPPQATDYDRLNAADKSLVDRAIFHHVVSQQGGQFSFAAEELRLHGNRAPNSMKVEWDITALREMHADQLQQGGSRARRALSIEGAGAPANATAMLNAINAFNGDECGCSATRPKPVDLNQILGPHRPQGGHGR